LLESRAEPHRCEADVSDEETLLRSPERRAANWIKYDQRLHTVVDANDDYYVLDFLKVTGCMI
jgi:hypothetical protein